MRLSKLLTIAILASLMSSCTVTRYQVFSTKPITDNVKIKNNSILYSDDICNITYNFWSNGGNPGFVIYNKSDEKLYVNLKESFFTLNGLAYDYYEAGATFSAYSHAKTVSGRNVNYTYNYSATNHFHANIDNSNPIFAPFSTSSIYGSSMENGHVTINGHNVIHSYTEKNTTGRQTINADIICIPPKSAKVVSKFAISYTPFLGSRIRMEYSINQTPIRFANFISYNTESRKRTVRNEFYVDKSEIIKSNNRVVNPSDFYVKYTIKRSEDIYTSYTSTYTTGAFSNMRATNTTSYTSANHTNAPTSTQKYAVGDIYSQNGKIGIVVSVSEDGMHGKIMQVASTYKKWSKVDAKIFANHSTNGQENQNKAISALNDYPAMLVCQKFGKDWYLPSINELMKIFSNIEVVNDSLRSYGYYPLYTGESYWSSTEFDEYNALAIVKGEATILNKSRTAIVIAVSNF